MQIARRIEEVGPEKMPPESRRKTRRDTREGNAAGVGGENRVRPANRFDAMPKRSLDLQILGDGLDDPIALGDFVHVVFEIAGFNQSHASVGEESAGFLLGSVLDSF